LGRIPALDWISGVFLNIYIFIASSFHEDPESYCSGIRALVNSQYGAKFIVSVLVLVALSGSMDTSVTQVGPGYIPLAD
jgi:hypothetical protein